MHQRVGSNQGASTRLKHESSRMSVSNKSTLPPAKKNFDKISKIDPAMFDEIEDPEERENLFYETIEKMKKSIEDLHLKVTPSCPLLSNRKP